MADSRIAPRLFEFHDGGSDKFWIIELDGKSHTVRYGLKKSGVKFRAKDQYFGDLSENNKCLYVGSWE